MPLYLPSDISKITLDTDDQPVGYFPFGFIPFSEHALGNGDYFGLYWPIGCEDQEPIVAETRHDDGSVEPMFSSLAQFLDVVSDNDEDAYLDSPSYQVDPASPLAGYQEAKRLVREQEIDAATALLEAVIRRIPEYTSALGLLATQYRRQGREDDACRLAARAIVAPPSFGRPSQGLPHWLARQDTAPEDMADDPVWLRRADLLDIPSGGTKDGGAYSALAQAIEAYIGQNRIAQALTLMQTYIEFMNSETRSFQERHAYEARQWWDRQRRLSEQLPHGPRFLI